MRLITILWVVIVVSYIDITHAEVVKIKCCDLWKAVTEFIAVSTGEELQSKCPVPCRSHPAINRIVNTMVPTIAYGSEDDVFEVEGSDILMPDKVSDVLVWSILGRLCSVEKYGSNHADFLQFNTVSQTISLRRTGCEYQKTVYSSLLGFCAVVLTFIILSGIVSGPVNVTPTNNQSKPAEAIHGQTTNSLAVNTMAFGTPSKGRYRTLSDGRDRILG